MATAFSLLGDQFLYAVLPTYYEELGLLPYQVGLLLSLNRWIRILTNHIAERLTRTWSPTWLLGICLALGALLTVVYGTVSLFPILRSGSSPLGCLLVIYPANWTHDSS